MQLVRTWFCAAMALSSASAAASVTAGGICMVVARRMLAGTMPSIRLRREASPMALSMCASSALDRPMWRATNSAGFSKSAHRVSDGVCMSMVCP